MEHRRVNYTHVCTAQAAQSFYPYTYTHIYTARKEREKKGSINYTLCHNMNECQPVYETNELCYVSRSMSSFTSSIDDWLIDLSIVRTFVHWNKSLSLSFSFIVHCYIYIYVLLTMIISNASKRFLLQSIFIFRLFYWVVWSLKGIDNV